MYNVYGHWPNGNEIWAERVSLEAAEDFRAMFLRDGASTVVLEPCDMAV